MHRVPGISTVSSDALFTVRAGPEKGFNIQGTKSQ
jgi:hypothetical protein